MAKTSWRRDYTRDIIDLKNRYDDIKEHIGEPPDGQVPLGDTGIYTSPNLQNGKAVDPRDCENYPDSPFCGGNPWTKTPVGFEPDWGVDECGAWVQVTPVLGFTKLPPVSVGWRRPGECREEELPPPPPPPPPEAGDTGRPVNLLNFDDSINPELIVFVVIVRSYSHFYTFNSLDNSLSIYSDKSWVENHSYPNCIFAREAYYPQFNQPGIPKAEATVRTAYKYLSVPGENSGFQRVEDTGTAYNLGWIAYDQPPVSRDGRFWGLRQLNDSYYLSPIIEFNYPPPAFGPQRLFLNQPDYYAPGSFCMLGRYADIVARWQGYGFDRIESSGNTTLIRKAEYQVGYISVPEPRKKYPPPPDQRRKKDCCMQCCNGGNQAANKQNQDNAEILRLLRKIDKNIGVFPLKSELFDADDNKVGIQRKTVTSQSVAQAINLTVKELQRTLKAIGIDHFPIYSPSSVIQDESNGFLGDLGDLKNKLFKQKIESLAEFLVWRAKNDNEIFGQWQEVIEIQDSDPNVKGNQPKRVVLPNMAKTLREIILLLSVLIKSQGFSMDALLKMYIDVANTKVSASISEAILRDIQDYLDYPTITKPLDVPMGITIPKDNDPTDDKEDVERFLKNSIIKAMFDDWTGEGSLHDMMLTLLDAASRTIQKPHT